MNRFIPTAAAMVFTFALALSNTPEAQAKPIKNTSPTPATTKKVTPPPSSPSKKSPHLSIHIDFRLRDYRAWTRHCWFPTYGCYGYCDSGEWYYWCESQGRFLPISMLAQFPPTTLGVTTANGAAANGTAATPATPGPTPPADALPLGATPVPAPMMPPAESESPVPTEPQ